MDRNYVISDNAGACHVMKREKTLRRVSEYVCMFTHRTGIPITEGRWLHFTLMYLGVTRISRIMNPISLMQKDYKFKDHIVLSFSSQITGNQLFPTIIVFVLVKLTDN